MLEQSFRLGFRRLQMFQYQRFQNHGKSMVSLRMVNHFGLIQQWYSLSFNEWPRAGVGGLDYEDEQNEDEIVEYSTDSDSDESISDDY